MTEQAAAPYLTIILTGRNDNFGGDFNERFFRALRFNHQRLTEAAVPHEFVFVEWAPIAGKPYLAELLAEQLPEVAEVVTSYVVDPRYHEAVVLNPRLRFMEFVAKNVGIRRCRGRFILSTNTDIYLGRGAVEALAERRPDEGTLYRATRVDLKLASDLTHVDWGLLEDERNWATVRAISPPLFRGATGDFLLLDAAAWRSLRGFNEVYRVAKIGVDANFSAKAYASGYPVADLGAPVYHLNHVGSYQVMKHMYRHRQTEAPWGQGWNTWVIYDNPSGWGLGLATERPLSERMHFLQYLPEAVPPLVDLRRVLLPPLRAGHGDVRTDRIARRIDPRHSVAAVKG